MSTITKERALQIFLGNGPEPTASEERELARIALASLEAEPVAYMHRSGQVVTSEECCDDKTFAICCKVETPLYTAPPAPVSVPDEMTMQKAISAINRLSWQECTRDAYMLGWNACRAAMLHGPENAESTTTIQTAPALDSSPKIAESTSGINQGKSEPVTTSYKLPFEQWLSQQGERIEIDCGCVSVEVFMHWLRMAYGAGNSPAIPDCSCHSCRPVTFADSRFVVCPECGNKRCPHANDHRNTCTGSNEPGQEGSAYPAVPQQEVKP